MTKIVKTITRWWWWDTVIWETVHERHLYRAKYMRGRRITNWYDKDGFTVGDITGYPSLDPDKLDKKVRLSNVSVSVQNKRNLLKKEFWTFDEVERKLEKMSDL